MEKSLLILSSPKTLLEGIVQTIWKAVFSFVGWRGGGSAILQNYAEVQDKAPAFRFDP